MGIFKPIWLRKSAYKGAACEWKIFDFIEKCNDQDTLYRIAKEATSHLAMEAAVNKLTNEEYLTDIAITSDHFNNCAIPAARKVSDPEKLAQIAFTAKRWETRNAAIKLIESQDVLKKLAIESEYDTVRSAALSRINDKDFRIKTGLASEHDWIRRDTIEWMIDQGNPDQSILENVAKKDSNYSIRVIATKQITSQEALVRIAKAGKHNTDLVQTAMEKLTDPALRADAIIECGTESEKMEAIKHLPNTDPRLPAFLETSWYDKKFYYAVIDQMSGNEEALLDIAKNSKFYLKRKKAICTLSNPEYLLSLLPTAKDPGVVFIRLDQLGLMNEEVLGNALACGNEAIKAIEGLERDKLDFIKRMESSGKEEVLSFYRKIAANACIDIIDQKDFNEFTENRCSETVEASILLVREFGETDKYSGPSDLARLIKIFLSDYYRSASRNGDEAIMKEIKQSGQYSVHSHRDSGHGSCHEDNGPLYFTFD